MLSFKNLHFRVLLFIKNARAQGAKVEREANLRVFFIIFFKIGARIDSSMILQKRSKILFEFLRDLK
jgi:hypothetical protein